MTILNVEPGVYKPKVALLSNGEFSLSVEISSHILSNFSGLNEGFEAVVKTAPVEGSIIKTAPLSEPIDS